LGALRRQRASQAGQVGQVGQAADREAPEAVTPPEAPAPAEASTPTPTPTPTSTPAPEPEAEPPVSTIGGGLDRDQLVQAWGDHILRGLPARAKALYSAGRFVSTDGGAAVFALPNAAHCDRCRDVKSVVESAVSTHFGVPVVLELVVDGPGGQGELGDRPAAAGSGGRPPSGVAGGGGGRLGPTADGGGGPAAAVSAPEPTGGATGEDEEYFDMDEAADALPVESVAEARVREAFPGIEEV
jgi:hypothetical protein